MIVIFFLLQKNPTIVLTFFTNPITLMMNKLFICVCTQKFLQRANTADDIMPGIPLLFFLLMAKWAVSHVFFFSFSFTHIQGQGSWSKCFMITWKKLSLKVLVDKVVVFFSYNILPHIVKAFWNTITFFISFSPMYNVCFVVFSMCVHYKSWIGAVWTSE